jgi:hypothetical protein
LAVADETGGRSTVVGVDAENVHKGLHFTII